MSRKPVKRIEKFVSNRSLDDFLNNEMLQSAVERQSEIIGEALNQARGIVTNDVPILLSEVRSLMEEL
jgi:uncharacterized protein with HEPN domain